ncbi:unnamed protein product [Acanthoscelides obtectus]|nr:unnamed protein product [Acanthoscelides obtectus]CAK1647412.1 hypothetical protein AOBTE_LOCUS15215 [Acanthoscelides obtectus]
MFSDNDDLLMAISSIEEFDLIKLQPLKELGIELPSIEEFSVVKDFVTMEQKESIFSKLYKHRRAFRATYQLFATIATFG